jgi:four helix bundle protein
MARLARQGSDMRPHHHLKVWQAATALVRRVLSAAFPADGRFGLTAQIRRRAVSVPSNVAEGAARGSARECARFLMMARGSLPELDTQLRLAQDLGFADAAAILDDVDSIFAMLAGPVRSQTDSSRAAKPRPYEAATRPTLLA